MCLYAWLGTTWYALDILGASLPAGCEVYFLGTETQPAFTIAVGYLGKDLVRLWRLPIQQAWDEDWWEPVEGELIQ
ncbi:hypothetical protein ACFLXI_05520 [Chloroflexota bacterium]